MNVDAIPGEELRSEVRALMQEKEQLRILVAWQAALLSEGAACQLLGVDRVTARTMLQATLSTAAAAWTDYRAAHPPMVPSR